MNRHLCSAAVFVLAVAGLAASEGRGQETVPSSRSIEAAWQAERAFHLSRTMERMRTQISHSRLKAEGAAVAPAENTRFEKTLAELEALVTADAKRTDRPAKSVRDIAAIRTMLCQALNQLDAAEVRFDSGFLTAFELDAAYRAVVRVLLA